MLVTGFGGLAQNTGNTVSTLVIGFSQVSTALSPVIGTLATDFNTNSFTTFNAAANAECGVYQSGEVTRQGAIDQELSGCGGWHAPTRAGQWQAGQLLAQELVRALICGDDPMRSPASAQPSHPGSRSAAHPTGWACSSPGPPRCSSRGTDNPCPSQRARRPPPQSGVGAPRA